MSGGPGIPSFDLGTVRMRPFVDTAGPDWLAVVTDEGITSCTSWGITSVAEMSGLVRRIIAGYADSSSRRWAVEAAGQGVIGSCGFKWWDCRNAVAEIAYELAPRYWRRGIAKEAVRTAIHHGFTEMGLARIEATVMVANEPSVRLLEGAGFTREGRLRDCRVCAGARRDFFVYGLLRSESRATAPDRQF